MKRLYLLALGLAVTSVVIAGERAVPPRHPDESEQHGLMVQRSKLMKTKPIADLGVARYWAVEKKKDVMSLLVEVNGTIPMHFHPDGVHRMYILEGKLLCTVGGETMEMGPGDYMQIPRAVRHKFEKIGDGKAYFVTVDSPPINPANNVWLEPAPGK
jgi:quercetin dioxygenase-like cupin family protein